MEFFDKIDNVSGSNIISVQFIAPNPTQLNWTKQPSVVTKFF